MRLVRARGRAIMAGVVLGCVTVAGLTLLAVLGLRPHQGVKREPMVVAQPELRTALLTGPDLPGSFAPSPSAAPTHRTEARDTRCRALLADPTQLLDIVAPASSRDAAASHSAPGRGTLEQALRVMTGDDATRAFKRLIATTTACRDFAAKIDGMPVRVRLDGGTPGLPLLGDTYTVRMTVISKTSRQTGFLALGRVGTAISVLRRLGPETSEDEIAELVQRALTKLLPLGLGDLVPTTGA